MDDTYGDGLSMGESLLLGSCLCFSAEADLDYSLETESGLASARLLQARLWRYHPGQVSPSLIAQREAAS